MHQVVTTNHLNGFDFALNGALDETSTHAIASAAFVDRAENLLLIGGPGTGKTMIARAVEKGARANGKTFDYLDYPDLSPIGNRLFDDGPCYITGTAAGPGLRRDLLDCDLLLVDEAHEWLAMADLFSTLLRKRTSSGKSTILVITSTGWQSMLANPVNRKPSCWSSHFWLAEEQSDPHWMRFLSRFPEPGDILSALGVVVDKPQLLSLPAAAAAVQDLHSGRTPVWHVLYTGENSYRLLRKARGY